MYTMEEIQMNTGLPSKTQLSEEIRNLIQKQADIEERLKDMNLDPAEHAALKSSRELTAMRIDLLRDRMSNNLYYTRGDALDTWKPISERHNEAFQKKQEEIESLRMQLLESMRELAQMHNAAKRQRDTIDKLFRQGQPDRSMFGEVDSALNTLANIKRTDSYQPNFSQGTNIPELLYLRAAGLIKDDEYLQMNYTFNSVHV